jgi:hypothetical protein
LVLPVVLYHSIESVLGGLLLFPLKTWLEKKEEKEIEDI